MSLFKSQAVFCQVCGVEFYTTFQMNEGKTCSDRCCKELKWRHTLAIMGKAYYPKPESV